MPCKKRKTKRKRRTKRKIKTLDDVLGLTVDLTTMSVVLPSTIAVASQVSKAIKK